MNDMQILLTSLRINLEPKAEDQLEFQFTVIDGLNPILYKNLNNFYKYIHPNQPPIVQNSI